MNKIDLANSLFGKQNFDDRPDADKKTSTTKHGVALEASQDGMVTVAIDPTTVSTNDHGPGIRIPTIGNVGEGDDVLISTETVNGMSTMVVIGASGSGDSLAAKAEANTSRLKLVEGQTELALGQSKEALEKAQEAVQGVDEYTTYQAICTTKKDVTQKDITLDSDFKLREGATVSITFREGNTVDNAKLAINGGEPIPIYTNGMPYSYCGPNTQTLLMYDGTNWNVCSQPLYGKEITIGNPSSQNVYIDQNGMSIRNEQQPYAKFNSTGMTLPNYQIYDSQNYPIAQSYNKDITTTIANQSSKIIKTHKETNGHDTTIVQNKIQLIVKPIYLPIYPASFDVVLRNGKWVLVSPANMKWKNIVNSSWNHYIELDLALTFNVDYSNSIGPGMFQNASISSIFLLTAIATEYSTENELHKVHEVAGSQTLNGNIVSDIFKDLTPSLDTSKHFIQNGSADWLKLYLNGFDQSTLDFKKINYVFTFYPWGIIFKLLDDVDLSIFQIDNQIKINAVKDNFHSENDLVVKDAQLSGYQGNMYIDTTGSYAPEKLIFFNDQYAMHSYLDHGFVQRDVVSTGHSPNETSLTKYFGYQDPSFPSNVYDEMTIQSRSSKSFDFWVRERVNDTPIVQSSLENTHLSWSHLLSIGLKERQKQLTNYDIGMWVFDRPFIFNAPPMTLLYANTSTTTPSHVTKYPIGNYHLILVLVGDPATASPLGSTDGIYSAFMIGAPTGWLTAMDKPINEPDVRPESSGEVHCSTITGHGSLYSVSLGYQNYSFWINNGPSIRSWGGSWGTSTPRLKRIYGLF